MEIPSVEEIRTICNRTGSQSWKQARAVEAFLKALDEEVLSVDDALDAAQDLEKVLTWMNREGMLV